MNPCFNVQKIPSVAPAKPTLVGTLNQVVGGSNPNHVPTGRRLGVNIALSQDGKRHLEASLALSEAMQKLAESGEGTGDKIHDLAIAFDRVKHLFNPASESSSDASNRFVKGEMFTRGEIIYYNNNYWEILQDFTHNGDSNWRPGLAHSLFGASHPPNVSRQHCPYLQNAFKNIARALFHADAVKDIELGIEMNDYHGQWVLSPSFVRNEEDVERFNIASEQATHNSNIFAKEFLQKALFTSYLESFNAAISLVRS